MKRIEKRLSELEEQETKKNINIPIWRWVEQDRTELEELTGIKYTYEAKKQS